MKFALAALSLLLLALGAIGPRWAARGEVQTRAVAVRFTAFAWLLTVLLIGCAVFLPSKGRALLLLLALFTAVFVVRLWRRSHLRARQSAREQAEFERARRLN